MAWTLAQDLQNRLGQLVSDTERLRGRLEQTRREAESYETSIAETEALIAEYQSIIDSLGADA